MNRALKPTTDAERAERLAEYRADMAQLDEDERFIDRVLSALIDHDHYEPDDLPGDGPDGGGLIIALILFAAMLAVALAVTFAGVL